MKILITGAGSGIGKDTAFALAQRGHKVIATTETESQASSLMAEVSQAGFSLAVYKLDITNASDRETIRAHNIDILINNAGIGETGPLAEIPLDRIRNNFETNVFSTIALTQVALHDLITKGKGKVIVVSSLAGRLPFPFISTYSMTKHALSGGIAALRREVNAVAPNVHVSLIEPGAYATGFNQRMFEKKYEWINEQSLFYGLLLKLRRDDASFIRREVKNTRSIVAKIVQAVEARKPRLRYTAPAYQAIGVALLRAFGL